MSIRTVPQLFSMARGIEYRTGNERCFYCCGSCDDTYPAKELVKKSFTSRDTVAGGDYICCGCVAAMDEKAEVTMPDGETRTAQKIRSYSWLITQNEAVAASKSHRTWLLGRCLAPPKPPYAIVISDSGKKHLLYRGVTGWSEEIASVSLEGQAIHFRRRDLTQLLILSTKIAAAIGKPLLSESHLSPAKLAQVAEYHRDTDVAAAWESACRDPLTSLAVWFTPSKPEAQSEYPRSTAPWRTNN